MPYQTLAVERDGPLAVLTLNRPEKLNAISYQMAAELLDVLHGLRRDLGTKVLIVTGAGRGFCSGTDLTGGRERPPGFDHDVGEVQARFLLQEALSDVVGELRAIPQPVIAAVNGPAAGGGLAIALAADVRYAAPSARFIASFVKIGLSGGEMGASFFLPRVVGASQAAELLYTGRAVDAEAALRMGLVSRVVPEEELLGAAKGLAAEMLASVSPAGLRMTKELLNVSLSGASLETMRHLENRTQILLTFTEDHREGVQAFRERRGARFQDR
ncbi:MAG TPA: enoyl-CoA hydratase-related protein [Dehalococcoidia bacterium]